MLNLRRLAVANYVAAFVSMVNVVGFDSPRVGMGWPGSAQFAEAPIIRKLSPKKGAVGTVVVVDGKNFTPENNVIEFTGEKNFAAGSPVGSNNGTSLQFRITSCPSYQPECPGFYVPPGVYHVTVINAGGRSNSVAFSLVRPK